jgi:hypothetical protein
MEDLGFRRLSESSDRDLPPLTQDRMVEIAHYLAQVNPLAHWLIETNKDFVIGEGLRLEADDAATDTELQDVLDEHWYDPINNWPAFQEDVARELGIFGEQIWPVFTHRTTGRVRLSSIDPALVSKVIIDPDNARIPIGVAIKKSLGSRTERVLRIIYDDDDAALFSKRTQRLRAGMTDGECFYSSVNKLSTASRGISDLLHLFDWLDGYDQFLFDMLERTASLGAFVWDVLLKGADEAAIRKWLADNGPPRRNSVRAHNEGVEWNAVAPDFKAYETDEAARLLRNQILGGAGIPEHWYGGGGDVNRAVGAEMGEPTYKRLASRQRRIKGMIERVADYQITQAVLAGRLRGVADPYAYSVVVPEMISKDLTKIGSVIASLASALSLAKTDGLIDEATAQRIFATPVGQLGVEINLAGMAAKIAEEQERREAQDYERNPLNADGANPPSPPFDKGGKREGENGGFDSKQARRGRVVPSRIRKVQLARRMR